jgi:hypothetical protein
VKVPPLLSAGVKASIYFALVVVRICVDVLPAFHLSISSVSHGLSFLCVEGILIVRGDYEVSCELDLSCKQKMSAVEEFQPRA